MRYESWVEAESASMPGVRYAVERMSFGRRLDLMRQLQEWMSRLEFVKAGPEGPGQQAEAALLAGEIERIYLRWGLRWVRGLEIDGEEATVEGLIEKGPEVLVEEAAAAIRRQAGLSGEERKNCESPSIFSAGARPDGSATTAGV